MTGGWVDLGGRIFAWRDADWHAARERREAMARINVKHAYTPRPASLISTTPWQLAGCSCSWSAVEPLPPEKAAERWRFHIASIDSPQTWRS